MKVVSNSTVVPNPADRSSGVQKVFSVTDEGGVLSLLSGYIFFAWHQQTSEGRDAASTLLMDKLNGRRGYVWQDSGGDHIFHAKLRSDAEWGQ